MNLDIVKHTVKFVFRTSIQQESKYSSKYKRIRTKLEPISFRMDAILNNFRDISYKFYPYFDLISRRRRLKLGEK